jgi:hypothetical protein
VQINQASEETNFFWADITVMSVTTTIATYRMTVAEAQMRTLQDDDRDICLFTGVLP